MVIETDRSRTERTPTTEANDLLDDLRALWVAACPDGSDEAFERNVLTPLATMKGIKGEVFEKEFSNLQVTAYADLALWPLIDLPITIACAHALSAIHADAAGCVNIAWTYVQDASYWHGASFALAKIADDSPTKSITEVARNAALKKNEENREIKKEAFKWLDDHFGLENLTIDDAAESLGKIVPMKFSTRRSYVIEWKSSR